MPWWYIAVVVLICLFDVFYCWRQREILFFLAFFSATKIKQKIFGIPSSVDFSTRIVITFPHITTFFLSFCTDYICKKNINLHVMFHKRVLFRIFEIDAIATYNIALFFYIRASLLFYLFIFFVCAHYLLPLKVSNKTIYLDFDILIWHNSCRRTILYALTPLFVATMINNYR